MADDANLYRAGHPLAKQIIKACKDGELKNESLVFDYSSHPTNMAVLEELVGKSGILQVASKHYLFRRRRLFNYQCFRPGWNKIG